MSETRSEDSSGPSVDGHISDTAFLVNESRSRRKDISRDLYAGQWVLPERRQAVRELWEDFASEVYAHDDLELSIRNRFFLDHLERFAESNDGAVFVNLGAGFTSYPLLLARAVRSIEVDLPGVIEFKERRLRQLVAEGTAPDRRVTRIGADLGCDKGVAELTRLLEAEVVGRPSFILLEGITYYLGSGRLARLVELLRSVQPAGSVLGFDFWRPEIVDTEVFKRLQRFFAKRFTVAVDDYNLFDAAWIDSIDGYITEQLTNAAEQERRYAGTDLLSDSSEILEEHYAILRRR